MQRFFSIIIPAHNEESIIEETLTYLMKLDYPADRYEVIVVENGSSDATLERAQKFATANFKILTTSVRGVSHARNMGAKSVSMAMEWCLFLDADTFLPPPFLTKLNAYLNAHPKTAFGTAKMLSDRDTLTSRFWYAYYNIGDWMLRVLQRVHIVRKDLVAQVQYDEMLHSAEDVKYGRELAKLGSYFFMWDNPVVSSARRFEKLGYLTQFWLNIWRGALGMIGARSTLSKRDWDVVRD